MQPQFPREPWQSVPEPRVDRASTSARTSGMVEHAPEDEVRTETGLEASRLTKVFRTRKGNKYHLDVECRYLKNSDEENIQESYVHWEETPQLDRCVACSRSKAQ